LLIAVNLQRFLDD